MVLMYDTTNENTCMKLLDGKSFLLCSTDFINEMKLLLTAIDTEYKKND